MNFLTSLVVLYAGFAASYWANGLLARALDLDHYGDVMVAMGVATILASLLLLGGQGAARRFLPLYLRDERYALMNGFVVFYCAITALASLVVAAAVLGVTELGLFGDLRNRAIFIVVMAPLIAVSTFLGSSLQSIGRPVAAVFPYQILRRSGLFLLCINTATGALMIIF